MSRNRLGLSSVRETGRQPRGEDRLRLPPVRRSSILKRASSELQLVVSTVASSVVTVVSSVFWGRSARPQPGPGPFGMFLVTGRPWGSDVCACFSPGQLSSGSIKVRMCCCVKFVRVSVSVCSSVSLRNNVLLELGSFSSHASRSHGQVSLEGATELALSSLATRAPW